MGSRPCAAALRPDPPRSRPPAPWPWRTSFSTRRWPIARTGRCRGWRRRSNNARACASHPRGYRWCCAKKGLWPAAAAAHAEGRQDADAVDRAGLRGQLLKAQAAAGDIVLLFGDESEALTHPYLAHVWAKKGADLRVPAPGQAAKIAMIGAFDWARRELIVQTSPRKRSADFIAFLEELDRRYGPKPGQTTKPVRLLLDNGPLHTRKATRAALAARASWLSVEWLPKYSPELNPIERVWRDLKRHHLAHKTFTGREDLAYAIHEAVRTLNTERNGHSLTNLCMVA